MKSFGIKMLIFTAAVSGQIACGTTSVTGPDAGLASDHAVSALRASEPLPPTVPDPSSPNTLPVPDPSSPNTPPEPQSPGVDDVKPTEVPNAGGVPDDRSNRRPPTPPDAGTAPQPEIGGVPAPAPESKPEIGGVPMPAPSPTTQIGYPLPEPVPADPSDPGGVPQPVKCLVASIEIIELSVFSPTPGLALEAVLFDEKHVAITDSSCSKLAWRVEATQADGNRVSTVTIDSSTDGRTVTLIGPAGLYKVGVTAPNGAQASRLVTIQ